MDKKKIIIISSSAAVALIIIAIICVIIFGKDDNTSEDDDTTSKVTEVTSTESDAETTSVQETESSSEVETTTEEITTEEITTQETTTVDPFTIEPSGKYTDKQELIDGAFTFYLRTYENGAKEYVVYVSIVNKYYRVAEVGVVPESVLHDIGAILQENYEKQEQQAQQQQQQQTSKPQQQTTEKKPTQAEIDQEIYKWIKSKYGDKFVYNEQLYVYDSSEKVYYRYDIINGHKMTSATTSQKVKTYDNKLEFSIDQIGYILGCPSAPEVWTVGWGQGNSLYDENLKEVSYKKNTEKYIKKAGCEEQISSWCNWEFMTTEGIPVSIKDDGYIYVSVIYPNSEDAIYEKFTIEEYYNFLNKYADKYYIKIQEGKKGFENNMQDYIAKWVVIKEN